MEAKDQNELPINKKPRSADLHKSLKDLSVKLKSDLENFIKTFETEVLCYSENTKIPVLTDVENKFNAVINGIENIMNSLETMKIMNRMKWIREDSVILPILIKFINVIAQDILKMPEDFIMNIMKKLIGETKQKSEISLIIYCQGLTIISCIGNLLIKRFIGDSYLYESLIKPLIKCKAIETILFAAKISAKIEDIILKSEIQQIMQNYLKIKEFLSKYSVTFAEILYTLLWHSNEDLTTEFITKNGPEILKNLIKSSFEQSKSEIYLILLQIIPIISQNLQQDSLQNLYIILKDQLFAVIQKNESANLFLNLFIALRSILSSCKAKKLPSISEFSFEIIKFHKNIMKTNKKLLQIISAFLLYELSEFNKDAPNFDEYFTTFENGYKNYIKLKSELNTIKTKHYDCVEVTNSLQIITKLFTQVFFLLFTE